MKILRFVFLGIGVALLAIGLSIERHEVHSLNDDGSAPLELTGPRFVEGATTDTYMRRNGKLFDIYSLSPLEASERDCKT